MNSAQQNCTVTKKQLLSIVATLKEFRNILLGQQITVFTDHKNLTHANFDTKRVMRWQLMLQEFGPDLQCIKGENNVVTKALSRLDTDNNQEIFSISICFNVKHVSDWERIRQRKQSRINGNNRRKIGDKTFVKAQKFEAQIGTGWSLQDHTSK
jgi:hypothetical protein